MSAFRNYYSYLVDIGSTVLSWKNEFRDTLVANGWVVLRENDTKILVRPPVSETIGLPSRGYGVLLVEFTETKVTFLPKLWYNDAGGYTHRLYNTLTNAQALSGSVYNASVTFGGDQVLFDHTPVYYSQNERTQVLYNNMVAAQTTYPTTWGRVQMTYDTSGARHEIVCTFPQAYHEEFWDVAYPQFTFTGYAGQDIVGTAFSQPLHYGFSTVYPNVTVDFSSGFIYYLSVFDRSITLATKTTLDYYGPISATWINNSVAVQQTPNELLPVELYAIDCSNHYSSSYLYYATTTHGIGYYVTSTNRKILPPLTGRILSTPDGVSNAYGVPLPSGETTTADERGLLVELARNNSSGISNSAGVSGAVAYAAGISGNYATLFGSAFPIVNVELFRNSITASWSGNAVYMETTSSFLDEVYMYTQAATEESLHLARIVDVTTTATANASDIATSIAVADTSLFPVSGTIIVNNEIIQYTSKTATTFSGLSRAQYGTAAGALTTGDIVYATNWFVKINAGAILAGTIKPTAQ